mgnify:CR=1 FL=1
MAHAASPQLFKQGLDALLRPKSIAIVGASESPDSWAPEIERSLRHVGFRGDLFPVNPKYDAVWGRPCVASVADLPLGVDLAVVVVAPVHRFELARRGGVRAGVSWRGACACGRAACPSCRDAVRSVRAWLCRCRSA